VAGADVDDIDCTVASAGGVSVTIAVAVAVTAKAVDVTAAGIVFAIKLVTNSEFKINISVTNFFIFKLSLV
jgi:hypothetical protein